MISTRRRADPRATGVVRPRQASRPKSNFRTEPEYWSLDRRSKSDLTTSPLDLPVEFAAIEASQIQQYTVSSRRIAGPAAQKSQTIRGVAANQQFTPSR
jgi:hypothetical protein